MSCTPNVNNKICHGFLAAHAAFVFRGFRCLNVFLTLLLTIFVSISLVALVSWRRWSRSTYAANQTEADYQYENMAATFVDVPLAASYGFPNNISYRSCTAKLTHRSFFGGVPNPQPWQPREGEKLKSRLFA